MSDPTAALEEAVRATLGYDLNANEVAATILAALPPDWCGHDIDLAWTAVEEVLPDGWVIWSVEREYGTTEWEAWAGVPDPPGDRDYGYGPGEGDGGWGPAYGHGSSPAAALRALRAALDPLPLDVAASAPETPDLSTNGR